MCSLTSRTVVFRNLKSLGTRRWVRWMVRASLVGGEGKGKSDRSDGHWTTASKELNVPIEKELSRRRTHDLETTHFERKEWSTHSCYLHIWFYLLSYGQSPIGIISWSTRSTSPLLVSSGNILDA